MPVAAARVREENEVAESGKDGHIEAVAGPVLGVHVGWSAVDRNYHGIAFRSAEVAGIEEPALHFEAVVGPLDIFYLAPFGLEIGVGVGELFPIADGTGPDFGRMLPVAANHRRGFAVVR